MLLRSTVAASAQAHTLLPHYSQKCLCSYSMTLQKTNLAVVGESCVMRLLADCHCFTPVNRDIRCINRVLYPCQKPAPHCIQQWQIQIQSKRPWNYWTTQEKKFVCIVQQMHLSSTWGTIKAQWWTFIDFITLSNMLIFSFFSWSHATKLIHSHDNILSWDNNTVDLIYLHKWGQQYARATWKCVVLANPFTLRPSTLETVCLPLQYIDSFIICIQLKLIIRRYVEDFQL